MAFEADVVVLAREVPDVRLVAEVKRTIADLPDVERGLRRYMLDRKCGLGLLVTQSRTRIYRDTFTDFSPSSIQLEGEYATGEILNRDDVPSDEAALESVVHDWLEKLASAWPSALPRDSAARAAVLGYLVPEVAEGRVSSGSLA